MSIATRQDTDTRFTTPLYTVAEAAMFLGVPVSTLASWAHGRGPRSSGAAEEATSGPVITATRAGRRMPAIPFVGLAEGMVVAAFRQAGVSMQHLRRAVDTLEAELGLAHALASRRLYTDGASVLYDYAEATGEEDLADLTVVVSQQRVFAEVVRGYLTRITYDPQGWAERLVSPATAGEVVVVDPAHAFGQPRFLHGGARVEDVVDRFEAGEPLADVAADFGVPQEDVEDYLRVVLRAAA